MSYYRRCPICRAYLDPGEICGCQDKERSRCQCCNTDNGKVENGIATRFSTSNNIRNHGRIQDGKG